MLIHKHDHKLYNDIIDFPECSENCQKMGGGFCVSPSEYSCCPYFDKLEGVCVDECDSRVNSSNHCTDECTGNWTGDDCDSKCRSIFMMPQLLFTDTL